MINLSHEVLNQIMVLVVIPILSAIATFIITWFRAQTEEIKKRMKINEANHYIGLLDQAVDDVVNALNQTIVDELKKASEDGKLTSDEAQAIKNDALVRIMQILGERGMLALNQDADNIECLICSKIESSVRRNKVDMRN